MNIIPVPVSYGLKGKHCALGSVLVFMGGQLLQPNKRATRLPRTAMASVNVLPRRGYSMRSQCRVFLPGGVVIEQTRILAAPAGTGRDITTAPTHMEDAYR
jgi:hypothetical protein